MAEVAAQPAHRKPPPATLLYVNVVVVATCGLVYELLAATMGSYLLGDSIMQFSLVIGLYLSAMGVGAWASRHIEGNLARRFVDVELAVALVGGLSAPILFLAFAEVQRFQVVLLGFVFVIGTLVGLELPLLMRILQNEVAFKDLISRVLSLDYAGALLASLLFPLVFVPELGLLRTSLVIGLGNALVGLWGTWLLADQIGNVTIVRARAVAVVALLAVGLLFSTRLTQWSEDRLYADEIVFAKTSPYQRIVVTRSPSGFQLFLNGNLQFASADEYRYHESLVHPAMVAAADSGHAPRKVLILGGGDGLAAREVLAHPSVEAITLVDLDPAMTQLAKRFTPLAQLNRQSLSDPRVTVVNDDAMVWLRGAPGNWDVVIVDFPDPNGFGLGKLYTRSFYQLLAAKLAPDGAVAVQATSPLFARKSFWCIVRTMRSAGFTVAPYHVAVPSFGVWGFALARRKPFTPPTQPPSVARRYLDAEAMASMFRFPADMSEVDVEINQLDNQMLVRYYESEWRKWQ
ncbi:MAG TPA: polyamine aminopropyltransferase [Kofleriaceae bacterium]|nr:polyamine aminopropyltransferase [Kofleriaceae bacterium]